MPQVFDVASMAQAKRVILTPETGTTTEERWEKETCFLMKDCGKHLGIGPETCVLDYGCGIGRVAKGLIEQFGCRVVGVDFSPSMRRLAPEYVQSERFMVWSAEGLGEMTYNGFRADVAICLWVIQHVLDPEQVVRLIARALRPEGLLYALNGTRCVPTDQGWVNDGIDVPKLLCGVFREETRFHLPQHVTTGVLASKSLVQVLRILQ